MKIFDGLDNLQAVKMGGKYVVALSGAYEINGEVVYKYSHQVIVDDLDNIKGYTPPKEIVKGYTSSEGDSISIEEYQQLQQETFKYYDDELGEEVYPDVETELETIKLRRWLESLSRVTEATKATTFPVEIKVVGEAVDTGSAFIKTPFEYGVTSFNSTGGVFKVLTGAIAKDAFNKWKAEHKEINVDNPTHSNIEYVKLPSGYVFTGLGYPWVSNPTAFKVLTSLEEAVEHECNIRKIVTQRLNIKAYPESISKDTLADVLRFADNIKKKVTALDVKQKAASDKRSTLQTVDKFIEELYK